VSEPKTCPSGRCREGAILLGVVGPTGRLGYLSPAIRIDADFVESTPSAEQRFRFAEPCVQAACSQWTGSQCGLAERLVTGRAPKDYQLPDCSIRGTCRWHAEHGADACYVCPLVITDNRVGAANASIDWDAADSSTVMQPSADRA